MSATFLERLQGPEPILYDGGFGTELFARGIELTNSSLACESHPDAVLDIHQAYLKAGAELLHTNTFVASSLHLAMADADADSCLIAAHAAQLAKQAVAESDSPAWVAGSLGPSPGAIEADSGDTVFGIPDDKVRQAHTQVAAALAGEGVDLFVIETMFSAKEAALAVDVARQHGLPIALNLTYKYTKDRKSGEIIYRTDWGHSAADMLDILAGGEMSASGDNLLEAVDIFGLNCGAEQSRTEHTGMSYAVTGVEQLSSALLERGVTDKHMMAYPNAGMPALIKGKPVYSETPETMVALIPDLVDAGAAIIGGCCGTTPEHIRTFKSALTG
jgi:methionine synthase I (cobalamin-dependent)